MLTVRRYLCVVFIILIPSIVNSQMIADTVNIDEITVFFEKEIIKAGITSYKISPEQKAISNHSSLSDLLKSTGIVFLREYGSGNLSTASIRGSGASHTQVSWNGLNINSPLTGQVDFSIIPVDFIDKISINPGNSGLQEHAGTIGGNILLGNLNSKKDGFHMKISQEIASFSTFNTFIKAEYGYKKLQLVSRFSNEYSKNNFPYINTATLPNEDDNKENALQESQNFMQDVYYNINNKNLLVINIWGSLNKREVPSLMSYEGINHEERQSDYKTMANLKWIHSTQKLRSTIQSGYIFDETNYILRHNSTEGLITSNESKGESNSFYNKLNLQYSYNDNLKMEFSIDYTHHNANFINRISFDDFQTTRNEFSIYSGIHKNISKTFTTYLLLRNSLIDSEFSPLSPVIGFEYSFSQESNFTLSGNIGSNYRFPSLNDLYFVPGGNKDLKPEKSQSGEIGLKFRKELNEATIDIVVNSFSCIVYDWILWKPTQFAYWQPENIDKVLSQGFESIIKIKGSILDFDYVMSGSYSFTNTTNESSSDDNTDIIGHQLIYIPIHKGNLLGVLKKGNSSFNYNIQYTGMRYTNYGDVLEYNSLPAYFLHNVGYNQKIKTRENFFNVGLTIKNILNTDYQNIKYRATPGINFSLKVNYEF